MDMSAFIKPKSQNPSENTGGDAEHATGESLTSEFHIPTIPILKLKALFKDIETELKHRDVTDKREALERMRDIAAEYGLTLSEVINKDARLDTKKPKPKNADQNSKPKYSNPDNPDQTWSGRGHMPKWLKEALATGKTLEEFSTQQSEEQPETAAKEQEREVFNL
jgi:DNA-binding protein H-NS